MINSLRLGNTGGTALVAIDRPARRNAFDLSIWPAASALVGSL